MAITRMLLIQITQTIFGSFMLWQSLSVIIILVLGIWLQHEPINSTQGRKLTAESTGTVGNRVEWSGIFELISESHGDALPMSELIESGRAGFVIDKDQRSISIYPADDAAPLRFFITPSTDIELTPETE